MFSPVFKLDINYKKTSIHSYSTSFFLIFRNSDDETDLCPSFKDIDFHWNNHESRVLPKECIYLAGNPNFSSELIAHGDLPTTELCKSGDKQIGAKNSKLVKVTKLQIINTPRYEQTLGFCNICNLISCFFAKCKIWRSNQGAAIRIVSTQLGR